MLRGLPTEQSSLAGMPPVVPPGVNKKRVLVASIKMAEHQLEEEQRLRHELELRTDGIKERLTSLESIAPMLRSKASSFDGFVHRSERRRADDFLGERSKLAKAAGGGATPEDACSSSQREVPKLSSAEEQQQQQLASSTAVARDNKKTTAERIKPDSLPAAGKKMADPSSSGRNNNNNNNSSTTDGCVNIYEARQRVGASHEFPHMSSFFSHPPRDARGFLLPQTHRSSKRSAYCTTYSGEKILGESEVVVNRERMKRAEAVTLANEAKERARRELLAAQEREQAKSAESTEPPPLLADAAERKRYKLPGMSRTAALKVHAMPPAGKKPRIEFNENVKLSSKRTLFYTDYTGKRLMIDACDRPQTHDFVVTGM